jgi:hypothetical protein
MERELLIEIARQGGFAKATAIDPVTGIEASVVGPASASQATLAEAARRKLAYLARKRHGGT